MIWELGSKEDFLAWDAGLADRLANFLFVSISVRLRWEQITCQLESFYSTACV